MFDKTYQTDLKKRNNALFPFSWKYIERPQLCGIFIFDLSFSVRHHTRKYHGYDFTQFLDEMANCKVQGV